MEKKSVHRTLADKTHHEFEIVKSNLSERKNQHIEIKTNLQLFPFSFSDCIKKHIRFEYFFVFLQFNFLLSIWKTSECVYLQIAFQLNSIRNCRWKHNYEAKEEIQRNKRMRKNKKWQHVISARCSAFASISTNIRTRSKSVRLYMYERFKYDFFPSFRFVNEKSFIFA